MKKDEVYKVIEGERAYQTDKMQNPQYRPSIAEELNTISTFLRKAQDDLTYYDSPNVCLTDLRIVAATLLRCLENHGVPDRSK